MAARVHLKNKIFGRELEELGSKTNLLAVYGQS
jgi:hypothetical protein